MNGSAGSLDLKKADDDGSQEGCRRCRCLGPKSQIEPFGCWVTLVASFWVNTMVAALETTFPLFYDPLRDKYDASRANVGTSASLMISFGSVSALLCTPVMNMYGCRPVAFVGCITVTAGLLLCTFAPNIIMFHVFYGCLAGVGYGLLYIPSLAIVQQTFTYNRGLATGLSLLGFTAGTVLGPILFEYLLREYGLFGSLLLQAGVHAQSFVCVWAFQSPKQYRHKAEQDADKTTFRAFCSNISEFSICRDVKFVLYTFVRLGWFFCRFCINTHCVSAATYLGVSLPKASYLPSVMGMCNLVLRSFSTIVLNFKRLNKEVYFAVGIVCILCASIAAGLADGYTSLLVAMILVGFNEGISTTSQPLVVSNLVGIDKFGKAMAVVEVATVPASLAAGPFSGWLVDITGNYFATFMVATGSAVVSVVLIVVIVVMLTLERRRRKAESPGDDLTKAAALEPEELEPLGDGHTAINA